MRKLGRPSDQRRAMLRGLVTSLIWNGRIETTMMRAKETQRIAEKLITKAIHVYDNTVEVEKTVDGNKTKVTNDSPEKLATRRILMKYLYDFPEAKQEKESKYDYKKRTGDVKSPVIEKLFREIAPKYAQRAKDKGQGGGYSRIVKKGPRRGDAAEVVILELV
ncbi:50S ribosomal protein L17 [Christensenellaceae bacterium]|nr:50S ribosomal protein L17 [Christensenellaceae bacterium]BDF60283.1 50S ribosomal protein L17 [Christensenellaceae bacterium]